MPKNKLDKKIKSVRKYGTPIRNSKLEELIDFNEEDVEDIKIYLSFLREEISDKLSIILAKLDKFVNRKLGYKVKTSDDQILFEEFLDFIQRNWIEPTIETVIEQ